VLHIVQPPDSDIPPIAKKGGQEGKRQTVNSKPPPFNIATEGWRGVGCSVPSLLWGTRSPHRLCCGLCNCMRILIGGFHRGDRIAKYDFNQCPGLTACGQIGTVLARLWGSDMRCKNRAKRDCGVMFMLCKL